MHTPLIPHAVSEICFLTEALYWIAFTEYPEEAITENNIEYRLDTSFQEDYPARLPNDERITGDMCERAGLPANPEWERIIGNDNWFMDVELIDQR